MILHLIRTHGANGGAGYAVVFGGSTVRDLEIEARMTLCNMAVEFSAFTGLIAPDAKTIEYLQGRAQAPAGDDWEAAVAQWTDLYSDEEAEFEGEIVIDADEIEPIVTWGTSPQHAIGISEAIPSPKTDHEISALDYQALAAGQSTDSIEIDAAFIGSCTNSRLSDLRAAAQLLCGHKVAKGVAAIIVLGSSQVKAEAEKEGLDKIFTEAGFEWRESGCSMCFYAGGETFGEKKRVISSTNRNFEGRQGPGTRTHLASPITVAASAIRGRITDPRELL